MDKIFVEEAEQDLLSIGDYVRWAVSRFHDADLFFGHGTDNAWDEALALVLHALHLPFSTDPVLKQARLTRSEKQQVIELVVRRIQERVPLAYLTHSAWFAGLEFFVDERVLVPRSPFAELIETQFAPWLQKTPQRVLDLCTGSGCIAIATALAFDEAEVDALDISADALQVAEINIEHYGLQERVIPIQSDLFSAIDGLTYDLIISNPPYVDAEDMAALPDEYRHEPELGLASGPDGLALTRQMLREAADHLNDDGLLFVEVGNSEVHLRHQYPDVPFTWIEFERGGHGVFMITKAQLLEFRDTF